MMKAFYPYIALLTVKGCGTSDCLKLPHPPERAFAMMRSRGGLRKLTQLVGKEIQDIDWEAFQRQLDAIERNHVKVICIGSDRYPAYLRSISMPPPFLFYKGDLSCLHRRGVAIVGTRDSSPRGVKFTRKISEELSSMGVTVVSGLARGIDTAAHEGSLCAGGPTLGILGTGIDIPYPVENSDLIKQVIQKGCLLSEQLMGIRPMKHTFPLRNRLISAFSHAVIVVEAGKRSGALITARWAVEQGGDVGAVPGFPGGFRSHGVNSLLKRGAFLVEGVEDIIQAVPKLIIEPYSSSPSEEEKEGFPDELFSILEQKVQINRRELEEVLRVLSDDPIDIDSISQLTRLGTSKVTGILTTLRLVGLVDVDGLGHFYRSGESEAKDRSVRR